MATINFLPVCSYCGRVLYSEEINYIPCENDFDIKEHDQRKISFQQVSYVIPSKCPTCGAILVSIQTLEDSE